MNVTEQNSHTTARTHLKAAIVYIAPYLQPCQLVPAINAEETIIGSDSSGKRPSKNIIGCCQHGEHTNYKNYAMSATDTKPTKTLTTDGTRTLDMRIRSSRNKDIRERRKYIHGSNNAITTTRAQTDTQNAVEMKLDAAKTTNMESDNSLELSLPQTKQCSSKLYQYQNDKKRKTNTQLDDNINIRNRQFVVMPICESRLENLTATTIDTTLSGAWPTELQIAKNTKINSQTTTLECRCFKENSDITYEVDAQQCSSIKLDQLPRRTFLLLWQQILLRNKFANRLVTAKSLFIMVMLILISSANCWTGRQDVASNCTFPARWEGSWFLSGYQPPIHIKGSQFSYRGKCVASDGTKYLIVDEKGCHRCLVIYEKHKNVLQYKESECEGDSMYMHQSNPSAMAMRSNLAKKQSSDHMGGAHPNTNSRLSSSDQYIMRSNDDMNDCPPGFCKGRETLQNLCDQIPGDALLYSLFRESAEPVKCPLKGPFVFTYNRGHGECKSPVSNIESCTEDSRLLLSFQACPDVLGTESTVEELTCLATWKDGNSRYLVGLVSHHHAISNEERYRCFVYEKISSLMGGPSMMSSKDAEYKLAQSGDATCNGLDSADVGSRIMSLRKPPLAERCDFPVWFKGPRHWHALMGNAVYNYHSNDGSVHIIKPNGYMETRALCEQINKQTSTEMMAVVHYTTGCQSGFMCMMFYRRDTHVIEIQTGKQASRLEDACAPDHFDIHKMSYITLLASNPDPQICPLEGLYYLRGAIGPPYLTTRHKRNHNNKPHGAHGHHHLTQIDKSNTHKRHSTLSFRNLDRIEKSSWHANTRGLPVRSRRAAASTVAPTHSVNEFNVKDTEENVTLTVKKDIMYETKHTTSTDIVARQRSRRDVPGCVTNVKSQRQLWIGCTEPNVIDVRPLCNEDGDEEYSCHGSWSENGTVYIIARHKGTKHGVCISYRITEGTSAKFVVGDACYRGNQKPPDHHLVANLSVLGKCGETGSASTQLHANYWLTAIVLLRAAVFILNHR